jgi:hypothetical protein
MHKLSSKLKFCENEPTNMKKIEKTLSTMLPAHMILQQQYHQRDFTVYSELIKTLLQTERHNELLIWNSNQGPVGAKPLPKVHTNSQKRTQKDTKKNGNPRTSKGKNKHKRTRKPQGAKGKGNNSKSNKDKSNTCTKCGCYNHLIQKCRTLKHLVNLYLNSVRHGRSNQGCSNQGGQQSKAHFNALASPGCSNSAPADTSNTKAPPPLDGNIDDTNNMIIEYTSDDLFGDYN